MAKEHIVVIGAGPAGLTAAYELLKKGYRVTILEQDTRIGGISKTVNAQGNRMDLGGHRFFSKDKRVTDWWCSFLPLQGAPAWDDKQLDRAAVLTPGGPNPETENRVMLVRNRVSRIYYRHEFFDYPISMKLSTVRNMGFVTTVEAGCSYLKAAARKLPETSLENFYINRFGKKLYSMFFEAYTEKLWGRHPREISADWGAQRVKGLSIRAILKDMLAKLVPHKERKEVETSLIEQFWYPKYGPGQLWETVAEEIVKMGGEIRLGACVAGLSLDSEKVTAVLCAENGKETVYSCDKVMSSMPLKDLVAAVRGAQVPQDVAQIAAGLPYRDYVTVGLLLPRLALPNKTKMKTLGNIVPDCWMYIQDAGVKMGRVQIFNNWSPYMVNDPAHTVWVGLEYFCTEGDAFWNMTEQACTEFALKELRGMKIVEEGCEPLAFHRERVQKAYPAYFDTYKDIDRLIQWLDGIKNLYCIGRNGQHRYNNMDHSMMTAFEAVKDIEEGRTDRSNVWNVNTEQAYHEEAAKAAD